MVRRCVREIVLWGGLTALGVGIGTFAVPLPSAKGQVIGNHVCRDITCDEVSTYIGFFCGWCEGGPFYAPRFDKCMPTPGPNCTEDGNTFGRFTCDGGCTRDPVGQCSHTYSECQ